MALVAEGLTAKEVARQLRISHRTVEQHVAAAIEALGASNRLGAVAKFIALQEPEPSRENSNSFMLVAPPSIGEVELIETDDTDRQNSTQEINARSVFPPVGGASNEATSARRLVWIFRIAIAGIMLTCAAIVAILAVVEMAK